MAKYTITAGCGHTETLDLFGPTKERDRRLAWAKSPSGQCKACYAAGKRAEEQSAKNKEITETLDAMRRSWAKLMPEQHPAAIANMQSQLDAGKVYGNTAEAVRLLLAEVA